MNTADWERGRLLAAGLVNPEHGTRSTYVHYRCRCEPCKEANAEYQSTADRRRHERLSRGEVDVPHGRVSTYKNWMCRCNHCTEVHSQYLRNREQAS